MSLMKRIVSYDLLLDNWSTQKNGCIARCMYLYLMLLDSYTYNGARLPRPVRRINGSALVRVMSMLARTIYRLLSVS